MCIGVVMLRYFKRTRKSVVEDRKKLGLLNNNYPEVEPYAYQIAGHGMIGSNDGHRGILKFKRFNVILKPKQTDSRGDREISFYRTAERTPFVKYIPMYYGERAILTKYLPPLSGSVKSAESEEVFILLEDLTWNMALASIIDVKIGFQTWGPDASPEKIAQEQSSYRGTKDPLGISVTGMRVFSLSGKYDPPKIFGKQYGKSLTEEELPSTIKVFLDISNGRKNITKQIAGIIVDKLQDLLNIYTKQTGWRIYGSSIIIMYDSLIVKKVMQKKMRTKRLNYCVNVKMIDFSHAYFSSVRAANERPDTNYIRGLKNLIDIFKLCLDDSFYK